MTAAAVSVRSTRLVWAAGLAVALGAAVATAHGLYEVAHAAGAPAPIAALYPLITDGLALVAYATTTRLDGPGLRYAWTIVVLAAGLSGLAQAVQLAGTVDTAPTWLRFGVGAWPAIAAALVAHLLHLLAASVQPSNGLSSPATSADNPLDDEVSNPSNALYSRANGGLDGAVRLNGTVYNLPSNGTDAVDGDDPAGGLAPARDRARTAAEAHRVRHGCLPSVNQLAALADVARGTAAAALKELRDASARPRSETDR